MSEEQATQPEITEPPASMTPIQATEPPRTAEAKPATEEQLQEVKKEMSAFERSTLLWAKVTCGVFAITLLFIGLQWIAMRGQLGVMSGQLREMKGGSAQTDRLIEKTGSIATTTDSGIQAYKQALADALKDNRESLAKALAQNDKALIASLAHSKTALHVAERAYITATNPQLDIPRGFVMLPINNTGRIPSGEIETVVHAAVTWPNPPAPNKARPAYQCYWKRTRLSSVPPGNVFSLAIPLPPISQTEMEAGHQGVTIAGNIRYDDGFADDGSQEWLFCLQTTYHKVLQQILWMPCDAKTVIPQLIAFDDYPRNEQKD